MRRFPTAGRFLRTGGVVLGALSLWGAVVRAQGVVINEIHYNPRGGDDLEFIELYNAGPQAADLDAWELSGAVRFLFPPGSRLEAGAYAVVAKNRQVLASAFGLDPDVLYGDFIGNLANGGEEIVLRDAAQALADAVFYDDDPPWPPEADGGGPSLERLCPEHAGDDPANWTAAMGPTPGRRNSAGACPPPLRPPPEVAINEIYYHPFGDLEENEFVEIANATAEPIDLAGWRFSAGIRFVFPDGAVLPPGGFIVVCKDPEACRAAHGIEEGDVYGPYEGELSNAGERLTLLDRLGRLADSVRYGDSGDWPVVADGLGHSLEKIAPGLPSDDPASWRESNLGDLTVWRSQSVSGRGTSSRFFMYADGEAEFLIDNVSLVDLDAPDVELLPNGSFDAGIDGWEPRGNHADSRWEERGGPDGSGALRLIAQGRGSGSASGIATETVIPVDRSPEKTYRLSFDYKYLSGSTGLTLRLSGSSQFRGVYWKLGSGVLATPGKANSSAAERPPPFVSHIGRYPAEPTSSDATWLTARVRGEGLERVVVEFRADAGEPMELEMRDDGLSNDGASGDGVFGVEIPPQEHNTVVSYRMRAVSQDGRFRVFPPESDPIGVYAYYVNDEQPESPLPVYTLLVEHRSGLAPRNIIQSRLNCGTYRSAMFVHRGDVYFGGLRHRGQSVCGSSIIKRFLKFRFDRGREFQGLRKLNLQSLWTDKSLVREHLAWEAFRDIGNPYCFHYFVRLHVNGRYFGLYAALEHPDKRFLERNGLNERGNLYKAVDSREDPRSSAQAYMQGYEKKTNEDGDFSDLVDFLTTMHRTPGRDLVEFFETRTEPDRIIDYQAAQVLTNNRDYPHKNHYLYHDTATGRWIPITWDMDLTFGKRWDGNFGGVLNDQMDNPGITPWYTTRVDGGLGNHLLDKFFFQAGTWYRRAYIVRLFNAIQEKYTLEFYERRIAELKDLLWDEQLEDIRVWGRSPPTPNDRNAPAEFEPNLERVLQHIRVRRSYLINYLRQRERYTGGPRLKITEIQYNPPGTSDDGEFLELWNPDETEIDISGWSIAGLEGRQADGTVVSFVFPEGTVIGPREVFLVAKRPDLWRKVLSGVRVFGPYPGRLANEGEELRVRDAGPGHPATVDFVRYGTKDPWPSRADGLGYTLELTDVHPDRDNDLPWYWRASLLLGGTPGEIPLRLDEGGWFVRGDCNGDGRLNITDAVALLLRLFRGGDVPPCLDACDADGDLLLTASDAVFLLSSLFLPEGIEGRAPLSGACERGERAFCTQSTCEAETPAGK